MSLPILYKKTTKGQDQQWQIVVHNDEFHTIEGIVGGKLTTSLPTKCVGKNQGRANATTPQEQAEAEAKAKWQKKKDKGYSETLETAGAQFFEPMLAHEYSKYPLTNKDFKDGVYVQPKLDGLRCINQDNTQMSRNGKPYLATPHLNQNDVLLDGELYSHTYKDDFNKIVSLCKKQKPTDEELKESAEKVQYWVYDYPDEAPFSKRYEALKKYLEDLKNPSFILVPTYKVHSEEEIKEHHARFLGEGYEGTIVRHEKFNYENKRSKSLLKYKDFKDEEFKIVGYEEGTGGRVGTIGFFVLQHDKNPDLTFKSNVKGNFDYLRELWLDRDKYIGRTATVKYFNRTPLKEDGTGDVPRFPYIIKINREEYE